MRTISRPAAKSSDMEAAIICLPYFGLFILYFPILSGCRFTRFVDDVVVSCSVHAHWLSERDQSPNVHLYAHFIIMQGHLRKQVFYKKSIDSNMIAYVQS